MTGFRRLKVSAELLVGLFSGCHDYCITDNALPEDARVVSLDYDVSSQTVAITLVSASWDGPVCCAEIPELPTIMFSSGNGKL